MLARAAAVSALIAAGACGSGDGRTDTTTSPAGTRAVIWAVGDGANGTRRARAVADRIAEKPFDRLLYLGDVYGDAPGRFDDMYAPTYGRLAAKTAPVPGNHEWPEFKDDYRAYWRQALGREIPDWYSFRAGGWQLLALNSEAPHARGSAQHRWLRRQVRGRGTCRIAYWHRPRFSASTDHGDQPDMDPLWAALKARATIVLARHDHDMQRFKPIDGLTQFVSGAGGQQLYPLSRDRRLAFGNDEDYGALRLELRPGRARYAFVSVDGRVLDNGTLRCRR